MKISGRQRNAISPIVATVLIVAATLIAFAAVAGYVFGIFGGAANTANVQVTGVVLHLNAAGSISLSNSGTANTQVAAAAPMTLNYGGGSCNYATSGGPTTITAGGAAVSVVVPAPGAPAVYCAGFTAVAGQSFTGSISLTNGASATFTGSFIA